MGIEVSHFWASGSRSDHFFMKIYIAGKPWYDFGADWKSGSRVWRFQSWDQRKLSKIIFGIQPTTVWLNNNRRSKTKKRQADIYVFCVLNHKDKKTVNPLNLNQWDFYIIDTKILNNERTNQKTITLSSLLELNPEKLDYSGLKGSISRYDNKLK